MAQATKDIGLSLEQVEHIKDAQKRHAVIDPGCEKLTPEEFVNWHPVGGLSWEERTKQMEAAGLIDATKDPALAASGK
jgi:dUTPase